MGPRLEEILAQGKYFKNDSEFGESKKEDIIWCISKPEKQEEQVYTYDEAINLTGNGWYNISLLIILAFTIQSMVLDMFGFSVVVSASACDLQLDHGKTSTLLSMPLLGHAYVISSFDFSYDLGFIIFKPWRLLALSLASTLGFSAIIVSFFYESPKFLVNVGKTDEALSILQKIRKWNGVKGVYPVRKIILTEATTLRSKDVSLLTSLWQQTAPIFQPPLLQNTLVLFYITTVIYSVNNGFFLWVPVIIGAFFADSNMQNSTSEGFCDLIHVQSTNADSEGCPSVNLETLLTSIVQGAVFVFINVITSRFAHRRKTILIILFMFCSGCCFLMLAVSDKIISIVIFFGVLLDCLGMGIMFSYYVDLFPTSYRGMVSCLGVMVARGSALAGVNLVGSYIFTDCAVSLYLWGAYTFSGALVSLLLPADLPKK